ncbi:MAG TPA: hypothetical protein PLD47_16270 [Aggregatilineales bacterium]|nr:hypothetical protein [Anaerolineales bacterium]HRE49283.1 hypothetical protein [Aggregatilineales bacterium]
MATIANMTFDDLKQLILDLMEERRLSYLFGDFDMDESDLAIEDEPDNRTLEEVFASVEQNRWTPPAGSPTPTEMLRQNRDEH